MPQLLTGPSAEPLSLADAKLYLRVEHDDEDDLIEQLIVAARTHVENRTRRALLAQTWRIVRDRWPADGLIALPLAPLRSVAAARVFDVGGVAHTIDTQAFVPDTGANPPTLRFVPWAMAVPGRAHAGVEIDVSFGFGTEPEDVPEPLRQAMRLLLAHFYEHRGLTADAAAPAMAQIDALIAPYRVLSL